MDREHGSFIWDEDKEVENVRKHKVDFVEAAQAFADPGRKIFVDEKHSVLEMRLFCVGKVEGHVSTVRFTVRDEKIRIIGAGLWRKGRDAYEKD